MSHETEKIKVSVIVPVYNLQDFVESCIKGLCTQETRFKYEVIAVDDHSSDDSFTLLTNLARKYSTTLKVFRNSANIGLAKTMKRLLSLTSGEYIAYIDGDDIALPGKLQIQADYLDKNEDCTIVYHESDVFDSETNNTLWTYTKDYYNYSYIPQKATIEHVIRYGCFMQACTVMVRRHEHMIDAVDEKNQILLDHPWHTLNLLYGKGSIDFISEILGRYRIHQDSFGAKTLCSFERREQVLNDQLNVCALAAKMGVADNIVQAGIRHYIYATALYFLKAKEDLLFLKYIENSTDGNLFFDEKHKSIYIDRNTPDQLRVDYFDL